MTDSDHELSLLRARVGDAMAARAFAAASAWQRATGLPAAAFYSAWWHLLDGEPREKPTAEEAWQSHRAANPGWQGPAWDQPRKAYLDGYRDGSEPPASGGSSHAARERWLETGRQLAQLAISGLPWANHPVPEDAEPGSEWGAWIPAAGGFHHIEVTTRADGTREHYDHGVHDYYEPGTVGDWCFLLTGPEQRGPATRPAAKQETATPKRPWPAPPPPPDMEDGWRALAAGEARDVGDEERTSYETWLLVWAEDIGKVWQPGDPVVRRRIAPAAPETPAEPRYDQRRWMLSIADEHWHYVPPSKSTALCGLHIPGTSAVRDRAGDGAACDICRQYAPKETT